MSLALQSLSFITVSSQKPHSLIKSNCQNQRFPPHEPEFVNKGITNEFNSVEPSLVTDTPPAEIAIASESCQERYGKIPLDTAFLLGGESTGGSMEGPPQNCFIHAHGEVVGEVSCTQGYGKTSGVREIWVGHGFFWSPQRRRGGCYLSGSKRAKVP